MIDVYFGILLTYLFYSLYGSILTEYQLGTVKVFINIFLNFNN